MEELLVKALLKGDYAEKFKKIKERYGVQHRSEVVRICIQNTYESLAEGKKKEG